MNETPVKLMNVIGRFLLHHLPFNPVIHESGKECPGSETMRNAWQTARNRERYNLWELKYFQIHGEYPKPSAYRFSNKRHSNCNVIKFPRRKHQIIGAQYPSGPDAA